MRLLVSAEAPAWAEPAVFPSFSGSRYGNVTVPVFPSLGFANVRRLMEFWRRLGWGDMESMVPGRARGREAFRFEVGPGQPSDETIFAGKVWRSSGGQDRDILHLHCTYHKAGRRQTCRGTERERHVQALSVRRALCLKKKRERSGHQDMGAAGKGWSAVGRDWPGPGASATSERPGSEFRHPQSACGRGNCAP